MRWPLLRSRARKHPRELSSKRRESSKMSLADQLKAYKTMKKITRKVNKQYQFISLDNIIAKRSKRGKFRRTFSEEMSRLQLAHEIKAMRQKKRMTQEEVAIKADMPQSVIARIESGTHSFSISTLHKIARVFDKQIGLVG